MSATSEVLWIGGFVFGAGDLDFDLNARLSAFAGESSAFSEVSFGDFFPNTNGSQGTVAGYMTGGGMPGFSLDVPWETDLSAFRLRLDQNSNIIGNEAFFSASGIVVAGIADGAVGFATPLESLRLTLTSIPEPAMSGFAMILIAVGLARRR